MERDEQQKISAFAMTNFRNRQRVFGIKQADRRAHMYVIGRTGTGKSNLLETLARQDIQAGRGLAVLDPHGDLVERLLAAVPARRHGDVTYFDVPDAASPLGFNPLEQVVPARRALVASGVLEVFKKIWPDFWGPRLEHILRNALLALLDQPDSTLTDVLRLLEDRAFRRAVAGRVLSPQVRHFWFTEYEAYPARFRAEAIAPVQNKIGAFLAHPVVHRIVTQRGNGIDLRRLMDDRGIFLVNLAKGKIGEDAAALLGALLVARIGLTGLARSDVPESERRDFFVYLDEFQSYTTLSLANMLSELRKYRVNLILAHQYLSQLDERVRDAILGNVGTMICFRVGSADAGLLEKEFHPGFDASDLCALPNYHIYLKLMIKDAVSRPFSAVTTRFVGYTYPRYKADVSKVPEERSG
jgi:hypothetical protein